MVIVHLSGGFGNQLYSFAFAYALAKKRHDMLAVDAALQDTEWFFRNAEIFKLNIEFDKRIQYPLKQGIWNRAIINKLNFYRATGITTKKVREGDCPANAYLEGYYQDTKKYKNIYLKGNWSSEKYFLPELAAINRMYVFKEPLSPEAEKINAVIRSTPNSVALHYRRGDYVKLGASLAPDYFIDAMDYMKKKLQIPVFFCFSEDMQWVKQQFAGLPYDIRYPEYYSAESGTEDFRLIQSAEHDIISNSSYSWWAAYLNRNQKKIVVAPKGGIWGDEFCLSQWHAIAIEKNSTGQMGKAGLKR